jgi:hypothetical protein
MGLQVPDLDDRTYEELITDLRKRIPVHSEMWTDHNVSDPGITTLEMLAWVAESDIYELDRVTERHVRKYLRLLGVRPHAPRPATVLLDVDPTTDTVDGKTLAAGTKLSVKEGGTTRTFETTWPVRLVEADVAAVVSETAGGRVDHSRANTTEGLHFRPFGPEAAINSAVYLGFDADPFEKADRLDLFADYHEADLPAPASHGDEDSLLEPSVRVVWEHCTNYEEFYDPKTWKPVGERVNGGDQDDSEPGSPSEVRDDTNQLYHGGRISLPEPDEWITDGHDLFSVDKSLYWLRARIAASGHEVPPQLNAFTTAVVKAAHARRYRNERLARVQEGSTVEATRRDAAVADVAEDDDTTARPGQEFVFRHAPVLAADDPRSRTGDTEYLPITVGGTEWKQVADFDASGPDDRHYVVDHERGVVRFGDGVRGEVPEPDLPVRATWYDHGGGEAGDVASGADWQVADEQSSTWPDDLTPSEIEVRVRGAATGGADAESTDVALARLKTDLRTPYRAVTAEDYRYLATHTPGLRFGRAAVHVDSPPDGDGDCAPYGQVIVMVVPYSPRDRPEASRGFLEAVECHLQQHRLLTDELTVVTPPYVPVDVEVTIQVADGYAASPVATDVESTLEQFLNPLKGFSGDGWPFGRPVYRSEIYGAIEGVEGVDCVNDVELSSNNPGVRSDFGIDIPATALVYLDDATVITGEEGDRCKEWSR